MKNMNLLMLAAAACAAPAALAGTPTYDDAAAPNGTHVQSGSPDCEISNYIVTCSAYELAGVGNTNATASLSTTYSGTVLCTNPGGNVAPGQTQYPSMTTSSGSLSPKNGRLLVPSLSSSSSEAAIGASLMQNTACPNGKWTKSVKPGTIAVVGYTYTLTFTGYNSPYITISG
jgi:hypothetical protein